MSGLLRYDLVVIGAGPGGYVAAIRAAQLGFKVACVEKEAVPGGVCLRVGCIPSKALLESSRLFEDIQRHSSEHGIVASGVKLDLPAMMKRKETVVAGLGRGVEGLLKKNKVDRYTGQGVVEQPGQVVVVNSAGNQVLETARILIATGSRPASLPGVNVDGDRIVTSTEALAFPEVPKRLVVLGAGYIGLELGTVWRRLGAEVTVLEILPRILPGTDAEIAREAQKIFEKQGIAFQLGTRVLSARVTDRVCTIEREGGPNVEADRVLVAAGRVPNSGGFEKLGVKLDSRRRIEVNKGFATNVPGVFAIGDVIAGPMLAHKAEEEGLACAEMMATGHAHLDYDTIPAVMYTDPEVASVGRTEEQLKEDHVDYRKGVAHFRANGRALTLGRPDGRVKILADSKTDRVLGVHIIGPEAGDLINEAAMAMAFGASAEDIARCCHAHPTLGETLKEAAFAAIGRPLHA